MTTSRSKLTPKYPKKKTEPLLSLFMDDVGIYFDVKGKLIDWPPEKKRAIAMALNKFSQDINELYIGEISKKPKIIM